MNRTKKLLVGKNPVLSLNQFILRTKRIFFSFLVLFSLFVYFIIFRPMDQKLKESRIDVFTLISNLDYQIFEESVMRGKEAAESLSSRTMIRDSIGDYRDGNLTLNELAVYTKDKYIEGAGAIDDLISAVRYVDAQPIATYIRESEIDLEQLQIIEKDAHEILVNGSLSEETDYSECSIEMKFSEDYTYLSVYSPIVLENQKVGTDHIFYDLTEVMDSINDNSVQLKIIDKTAYDELVAHGDKINSGPKMTTVLLNGVYYSVGNVDDTLFIMTFQTEQSLFEPIMRQTLFIIISSIFLFLFFMIVIYFLLLRYINKGVEGLEKSRDSYKDIAYLDHLTKAHTRTYLSYWDKNERRTDRSYIIILLDLDRYKRINDEFGHETGDQVLAEFSSTLLKEIREYDLLIRYGGDEFLLILDHFEIEYIEKKIEEFKEKISRISIRNIKLTFSYGVEILKDQDSLEKAITAADNKMYLMKKKKHQKCENQI